MYYIIDLERSISSGKMYYWKPNKFGYTTNIKEAGLYNEGAASEIVETDVDRTSVKVHKDVVDNIFRLKGI